MSLELLQAHVAAGAELSGALALRARGGRPGVGLALPAHRRRQA